ncbi:MAG: galactokinase [Clostridiales bacterium]|nr:galactokinase [Clostridiales bacterium]
MTELIKLKLQIAQGHYEEELKAVYLSKDEIIRQRERFKSLLNNFEELFGAAKAIELFSAPGRTEICGNHTDHNHGRVLAAAINLDAIAAAAKNNENICRVKSEGYSMDVVELDNLMVMPHEHHRSVALLRGVCAGFQSRGYKVGGFDATTASDVLSGSGLSSSAAFEVLLGTILNHLYNDGKVSAVEIAQIAQYAENEYFGKPCGLMDQTASSVGGFVAIDFKDSKAPVIEKVDFDFSACGHALCIVDTKGSHSGLTGEYAAVKEEMESVAAVFNENSLRSVPKEAFESKLAELRQSVGDRAVLRAFHFYSENERVLFASEALSKGDFECFKDFVIESGQSSYMYNQNVYLGKVPKSQPVSVALCLSEQLLKGKGAWRVHGGGFAGTIQAFVHLDLLQEYISRMDAVYGTDSCYVLSIRPAGGVKIL